MDFYTDDYLPADYPVTIELQVGLYGSVPQTTTKMILEYYSSCDGCDNESGPEASSGPLTTLVPPLGTVPPPGDDGVRITLTYPLSAYVVEMFIMNVTLLATS